MSIYISYILFLQHIFFLYLVLLYTYIHVFFYLWATLPEINILYLIISYFKHILTEVVNPYNTRNTFFKYPIARHEYTRKTCLYQVINYVNYPPSNPLMKLRTDMSDTHSITGFALYHKNRTLESYSLHCRIIDCYVCRVCQ